MFIHRVKEGQELYYGLNLLSNENTLISFNFLFPLYPLLPNEYFDQYSYNILYGWRIKTFKLILRIRRWKNFIPKTKKVLFNCSINSQAIGKQYFVCSRKMLEDNKCLSTR
jgi:hypothetical protein